MIEPFVLSYVLICCVCGDAICDTAFKEHLPEDGHNRLLKHVGGYAVRNTINLHICICTCWSYFS